MGYSQPKVTFVRCKWFAIPIRRASSWLQIITQNHQWITSWDLYYRIEFIENTCVEIFDWQIAITLTHLHRQIMAVSSPGHCLCSMSPMRPQLWGVLLSQSTWQPRKMQTLWWFQSPSTHMEVNGDHSQNWNAPLFRGFRGEKWQRFLWMCVAKTHSIDRHICWFNLHVCLLNPGFSCASISPIPANQTWLAGRSIIYFDDFPSPDEPPWLLRAFPMFCHVFYDTGANNPLTNQKSDFKKHAKEIESRKNMVKSLSEPFKIPQSHLILLVGWWVFPIMGDHNPPKIDVVSATYRGFHKWGYPQIIGAPKPLFTDRGF